MQSCYTYTMRKKVREWVSRYFLPVAAGTIAALITSALIYDAYGNLVLAAALATLADAIVGYSIIIYRDCRARYEREGALTWVGFVKVVRNMVLEFGPASYLDSYVFRPLFFATFPLVIENYTLAILLGSLTAEITYFIPVILAYELRKRYVKD